MSGKYQSVWLLVPKARAVKLDQYECKGVDGFQDAFFAAHEIQIGKNVEHRNMVFPTREAAEQCLESYGVKKDYYIAVAAWKVSD